MREIQSFKFWGATNNCLDAHRPIEQEARTAHQATQLIFNDPQYASIYKLLNKHGRTIAKRTGEYMPPQNNALKDALARAQEQVQPKEAKKEEPVPQVPHLRGPSKLKQVQAALEPLLPQFQKLFTRADAEDMLRKHGHEHLIDKHSVHNALQGWLAERPQRHIKRVRAPDKQKTLGYEVIEEAKNQGRKAAKRAARSAQPPVEQQQHSLLGAPDPVTFDPVAVPVTGRNSAYAAQMMRANGHTNGHSPEEKRPVQEPSPPAAPSPAPAAPPPAPAGALAAQRGADILTLLASGMAEATEADLKEFEEAETMMLEGMDRMRRVVKKTGGFLSFRARAAELFGAVTP